MKKSKIIWGIILIAVGCVLAIQATLTVVELIKALANDKDTSSAGFYIGSIVAAVLFWCMVFALIIGGIKLMKGPKNKKVTYVSPFDKFK